MGLFSNQKKPCPICGGATPRLLATKIEDMPICKECDRKIDLPDGAVNAMSLEEFRRYIEFYDANEPLRAAFQETDRFNWSFLPKDIFLDIQHGLFRFAPRDEALAFDRTCLKSFLITEDNAPLFEGTAEALRCYDTDVADRAAQFQPHIDRFLLDRQEYEHMERMERMEEERARRMDERRGGGRSDPPPPPPRRYIPEPHFDMQPPVRRFALEIQLDHPYWHTFAEEISGPEFDRDRPSVQDYLARYQERTDALYSIACGLMTLLNPSAPAIRAGAGAAAPGQGVQAAQATTGDDAIAQIQKYKALLDAGVISEEEFTAKKRQLMGI